MLLAFTVWEYHRSVSLHSSDGAFSVSGVWRQHNEWTVRADVTVTSHQSSSADRRCGHPFIQLHTEPSQPRQWSDAGVQKRRKRIRPNRRLRVCSRRWIGYEKRHSGMRQFLQFFNVCWLSFDHPKWNLHCRFLLPCGTFTPIVVTPRFLVSRGLPKNRSSPCTDYRTSAAEMADCFSF